MRNIFIALFYVLAYSDQFKTIKENQLRGVGHQDPLRTPTHLRLSQKPKFEDFFRKPSLCNFTSNPTASLANDFFVVVLSSLISNGSIFRAKAAPLMESTSSTCCSGTRQFLDFHQKEPDSLLIRQIGHFLQ